MNEQHNTLLSECLDEVAKKSVHEESWREVKRHLNATATREYYNEAALLVLSRMQEVHDKEMKELQAFYEWASREGWLNEMMNHWYHPHDDINKTTEELKAIWKEESK